MIWISFLSGLFWILGIPIYGLLATIVLLNYTWLTIYGYGMYFFAPNGSIESEYYTFGHWWDYVFAKWFWFNWLYWLGWINILIPITNFVAMPLLMWLALLNHNLEDAA